MTIWIDGDACPGVVKDMVFRASARLARPVCVVANRPLRLPASPLVRAVCVEATPDAADRYIVDHVAGADLVITGDIPLAAAVIAKGAVAISPRGEVFDSGNIADRLSTRDLLDELRGMGAVSGGPAAFGSADKHRFAAALDRLLARR